MKTLTKKPEFKFDAKEHVYTLNDKPLTGVTTILSVIAKPALIQWAVDEACKYIENAEIFKFPSEGSEWKFKPEDLVKVLKEARVAHRKKKEKAGEAGTDVHAKIEELINIAIKDGGYINPSYAGISTEKQIAHFLQWSIENKVKFLASEKRLYSVENWFAGTADIICEIDGKLYVGDVKTSSAIYPEHFIQASAYAQALVEMGLYPKFDGVVILNCRKDGTFEHKFNYDIEGNFKCFQAALTLYRHLNAIK